MYVGKDYQKTYEVLSTLKNKKLKISKSSLRNIKIC